MKKGRKDGILLFFWVMMTQFTTTIRSRPNAVTPTISSMGREMFPVLGCSTGELGGLGTFGRRKKVLGAVLGPRVGSMCWDLVVAGPRATFRVGSTEVQTASVDAVPGMATELQFRWGLQVSV